MKKKLLSLLIVFSMILPGTASLAYWDVDYSDSITDGITYIDQFDDWYGSNIISGFPDGSFQPYGYFTREQVAKMFTEYIGRHYNNYYSMEYNPFWDIDSSRWSYYHILDLASIGIVNGYPDGSFYPDGPITRAELTQMLYTLQIYIAGYDWYTSHNYEYYGQYEDIGGHWAEDAIWIMTSVVGTDYYVNTFSTYSPDAPLSRVEAAYMIGSTMLFNSIHYGYYPDMYAYYH